MRFEIYTKLCHVLFSLLIIYVCHFSRKSADIPFTDMKTTDNGD